MSDPRSPFGWPLLILAILLCGPAAADPPAIGLRVTGLDGTEIRITSEQWAALPHEAVDVIDHGGAQVRFEGVPAREILKLAGAPLGKEMRGANLALYVVAEAKDGYRVVYSLTEFDNGFTDTTILIADKRDGKSLSDDEGPLRIVVPGEKRQGRWTRQLVALKLGKA
ncbi:MAG TPA: molybdopterin-dependent oxidoreductase [Burkholderiales bacterium]